MKKVLAALMVVCLVLAMIPTIAVADEAAYSVSTTIGSSQFIVGEAKEFQVTTNVSEGAEQKIVVGAFELYDNDGNKIEGEQEIQSIVTLEYKDGENWYEFYGEFGPASGFPMMDGITSTFRATFKTAGDYKVKVSIKDVNDDKNTLCQTEEIALSAINFVNSLIDTTLPKEIVLNTDTEFTCTTFANHHAGEQVWGAFVVEEIAALSEVAILKYQDADTGEWHEFYGDFGPAEGFPLTDATSQFSVKFLEIGVYNIKIFMKTADGTALCAVEKTVTVTETVAPKVTDATVDNETWKQVKTVTVTAQDAHSNVAKVVYSTENAYKADLPVAALQADGSYQFQVSANGTYYIWAVDAYDNLSEVEEIEVKKVDTTIPVINKIDADPSGWTNGTVTVKIQAEDADSGLAKVVYSTGDTYAADLPEADLQADGSYTFTVANDEEYNGKYYIWAVDAADNVSEVKNVEIKIEKILPTVEVAVVTPTGWTNGNATVSITALDTNSGVEKVVYSTENIYAADLPAAELKADGSYTFTVANDEEYNGKYYIWAVDAAGNVSENAVSVEIKIETTDPVVDTAVADTSGWTNGDVTISGKVFDNASNVANSGVVKVVYSTENIYAADLPAATLQDDGSYTFTVAKDKEYNGVYYVWAIDKAGNVSAAKTVGVKIDTTDPVVDTATANPDVWTNGDVTISGKVFDNVSNVANSGVVKVVYSTENAYAADLPAATLQDDGSYTFTVAKDKEYNGVYYVWAVDAVGNESAAKTVGVKIDTTAPVVDTAEADPDVWTNDNVTISGTVSDTESTVANSGVVKVVYSTENAYAANLPAAELKADGSYTFTVAKNKEYNGVYYVWAVDAAGNVSAAKTVGVKIDTTAPVVDEAVAAPSGWTNGDVTVSGTVSDTQSTVANSGVVKVVYSTENAYAADLPAATLQDDGSYTFTVANDEEYEGNYYIWAVDAAGNESEAKKVGVYIDTTAPTGRVSAEFYFKDDAGKADHCLATPWTGLAEENDILNYKLWANESINIIVIGTDDNMSEVASVEYYIDYFTAKNELQFKTAEELDAVDAESWVATNNNTIPAIETDNRFVVYVKITDHAGNYTYISTNGLIVDTHKPTGAYFGEKTEIEVNHAKEDATEEALKPENQNNAEVLAKALYNKEETVSVSIEVYEPKYFGQNQATQEPVEGAFSGLSQIYYQIIVDGNKQEMVLLFDAEDAEEDENLNGETEGEQGLISKWTGTIEILKEACNSNNVEVVVTAIDNAGNISQAVTKLMIDVTAPEIRVKYSENTEYSNKTRTAEIYVKERNFVEFELEQLNVLDDKTVNAIIAQFDAEVAITDWEEVEVAEDEKLPNGDHITHKLTVTFDKDDHYQISALTTTDAAGNPSAEYGAGPVFTIDKTLPEISISYNNNSAQNGKYFKANREVTIEIEEHNFDPALVQVTIVPSRGGTERTLMPKTNWERSNEKDERVAYVEFNVDGDYTFDISMTDLAGNGNETVNYGNSVAGQDFVIDTKGDMITQSGVENGVAYGYDAEVIPNIKITDINLQNYTVTLTGIQKDKTIDLTDDVNALLQKGTETVTGILDVFETRQDLDGIYTLTLTSLDKAGNEDSLEIVFTVNRFGSVYVFEDYLLNLVKDGGAFVREINSDLVLTEFNADKLVADSLKIEITVDGKPLENVKYTVTPEINDEVTVGSSGWYQYKYTISKDNFAADGVYKIFIASEDATGNTPENSNYEDKGIIFRVDDTAAEISSVVGLEKAIINAQEITVKYTVFDAIGLKSILVYVDGKVVSEVTDFSADYNNYSGSFTMKESTTAQDVRIVVTDIAGNTTDTDAASFAPAYDFNGSVTISTNIFVRWYANKGLFWGSIGGFVALVAAVCFLIAAKKKKNAGK